MIDRQALATWFERVRVKTPTRQKENNLVRNDFIRISSIYI
jgi:hypothetical protein